MQPLTNPKPGNTLNGASRLAAEVSGHYGALRIVALRDCVTSDQSKTQKHPEWRFATGC